jgi:amidase
LKENKNMVTIKKAETETYPENSELYKTFIPKIEKYRQALRDGILEEYKLPDHLIPKTIGNDVTKIPEQVLSEREILITELKAVDLADSIAKKKYSSVEVFKAYAKRATMAHQLTNCAMELFVDVGLKRAKELDEILFKTGKVVGPLHGVPVSLKEHYDYKGRITHGGYVGLIDNISTETNQCVQILYDAGAVFYIRTTEPQLLMHLCSNNNITGIALNPHNTRLTTGGSSSGEGAIAGMKGSAFGVGSDIGGSIRSPAGFCGVWGLRPTQKRIPMLPLTPSNSKTQEIVVPVLGPLARSAQDLELFMKVQLASKPWETDGTLVPLEWRTVPTPQPKEIKIAIVYDDGVVKPTPPILRGLKYAAEKLSKAGVKIVEWESLNVEKCFIAAENGYNADGGASYLELLALSGEPIVELSKYHLNAGCGLKGQTVVEYQNDAGLRDSTRTKYLKKMKAIDVDFILSPVYSSVAPLPETVHYWGYTNLWNILDFPNVIFPSGLKCDPKLDEPDSSYTPRNETEKYEYGLYDSAEIFAGAPISLQLTGKRWFDEEVVKAAQTIEEVLRN